MTKRKMATTTAAVVFVDDKAQRVQNPQQPLPAFTLNDRDLSLMSLNPVAMGDNTVQAFDNIDHLIDTVVDGGDFRSTIEFAATNNLPIGLTFNNNQHGNCEDLNMFISEGTQGLEDFLDTNFTPAPATGAGAMGPADQFWQHRDNRGFMMTSDQIQNQDFLNSADASGLEQIRQEYLFQQSDNFADIWHPNPFFCETL